MTDDTAQTPIDDAGAPAESQIIEHRETDESPRAGRLPEAEAKPEVKPEKLSTRDAIKKALDETEGAKDKGKAEADAKAEKAAKEAQEAADKAKGQRDERGKFTKAEKAAEVEGGEPEKAADERAAGQTRQSEGQPRHEPPARLLPKEREQWDNVPRHIKSAWTRMEQEYTAEIERHKQSSERYERLRHYDETAQRNGRDLTQSLQKVAQIEQALARNPVMGLEMILREIGPRKADGAPLSLYDVAMAVTKQPQQQFQNSMHQAFTQQRTAAQTTAQQQENARLKQELEQIKLMQAASSIIEPFKASHPRYSELEGDIAMFLNSGKIPASLSPEERLEAAYDMAERINPAPVASASPSRSPDVAGNEKVEDPAGSKSVRGAPSSGQSGETKRRFKSNREALEAVLAGV